MESSGSWNIFFQFKIIFSWVLSPLEVNRVETFDVRLKAFSTYSIKISACKHFYSFPDMTFNCQHNKRICRNFWIILYVVNEYIETCFCIAHLLDSLTFLSLSLSFSNIFFLEKLNNSAFPSTLMWFESR